MNSFLSNRNASALILIIIGIIGLLFGHLALSIAAIFLIGFGIYNIIKKSFDAGIISILIGIGIIIVSWPLARIIHYISIGCIILGIILYLFYAVTNKR